MDIFVCDPSSRALYCLPKGVLARFAKLPNNRQRLFGRILRCTQGELTHSAQRKDELSEPALPRCAGDDLGASGPLEDGNGFASPALRGAQGELPLNVVVHAARDGRVPQEVLGVVLHGLLQRAHALRPLQQRSQARLRKAEEC